MQRNRKRNARWRRNKNKSKTRERMAVTSIYVPIRALEWIEGHGYHESTFIREAIEEKIQRESGYVIQLERKRSEIRNLEEQLNKAKEELKRLEAKQEEWEEQEEALKLRKTIETAILHVPYKDAIECARDLRSLKPEELSWREWVEKVEKIWTELKVS